MSEDLIVLGVLPVRAATNPGPLLYDIHNLNAVGNPRMRLVGFSFFSEVNGSKPTADNRYVHLQDPAENPNQLPTPGCNYGLGNPALPLIRPYGQWLNDLACRRINFSRVFLFSIEDMTKYFPHGKVNGLYSLKQIAQRYVERLTSYITLAKQNGVVVCLTLFNDFMLRVGPGQPGTPLPPGGFFICPFNDALNTSDYDFIKFVDTPTARDNDKAIRQKFYSIQPPPGAVDFGNPDTWSNWAAWNNAQKLYATQRYLITQVVSLTKDHWNVMYEISNEPRPTDDLPQSETWLFEVASWVDGLLWDANFNRRKRLVMLNLGTGTFRESVLKRLLTGAAHHLIDVFAFHGTEWTPAGNPDATIPEIQTAMKAAVTHLYNIPVSTTPAKNVRDYPVAILFDSDANRDVQAAPTRYVKAALDLKASFNYRWSGDYITKLTTKLEEINHGNAPAGFSVATAADLHGLTFQWNRVPQAAGYRIKFYAAGPEYPAYQGYGTVGAPAAGSEITIANGATTQHAVSYPGTFCVSASIRAYFANGEETAESPLIRVATGLPMDCEVVGLSLPSGDLSSHAYQGWIDLKNTGWFPWTRYTMGDPNNIFTFDVSLGVGTSPTGITFTNSQLFLLQPQDPSFFVRTGQTCRFQINYTLPNSSATLYVHHYFDHYIMNPGYTSRVKDLNIVRAVRVLAQAAP
ncbi:MAG TPA: hypothetical protein VJZ91_04615 [Blastocatellia bacterium]|nr:hypothetical protein [Blastocatellia bacterium]